MPRNSSIDDLRGMPPSAPAARPAALPEATPAQRDALKAALARHLPEVPPDLRNGNAPALLPVLHEVQDALGFVPPALVPELAQALNLSRAEVHGVVTYYHHFRTAPPGRHVVQICQAEACRANGALALMAHAAERLACKPGETRADGAVTLEPVYCLGLCASGPSAMVDGEVRGRLSPRWLDDWVECLQRLDASEGP
jgi:formate dehydrogenase subunit gamma